MVNLGEGPHHHGPSPNQATKRLQGSDLIFRNISFSYPTRPAQPVMVSLSTATWLAFAFHPKQGHVIPI